MKRFKTKKQNNYKKLIIMALIFVVFLVLFIYLSNLKLNKSYKSFIKYMFKNELIIKEKKDNPLNILMSNVDYLMTNYVFEIENKTNDNIIVQNDLIIKPTVYIYNTHDSETYKEGNNYNIKANVITASHILKNCLKQYNIESIVEEKSVYKELGDRKYSESYKISRKFLEETVLQNSELNYFIDIHRDSVSKNYTLININNKPYAKIMFVLGLENKNYEKNKVLMIKLNDYLNKNYKGLSRGIYEKSGIGVNGVYNQDFHPNTILIEIGGVDNDMESVFNSTQIIAEALYYVIGDENEKNS